MPGVSKTPGSWLESADAFVLSSRFEGWGIVLLEAMTWGLPCVSFDCEWGPREMIANGVNGILVENGNVDALAAELSRLMGDETLRKSLSKAARSSTRKFASEVVMAKWDEVVDTVLLHKDFARRVPK
jgi:glycosyltransferase involved in cell wall biosynthesis